MAADNYRRAEDEYFRLRGQFDTGRVTQEQFDEKLRELMQQDPQGRYWMLGADSGKWYYYDGAKWVQGNPYGDVTPAASTASAPAAAQSETPPATSPALRAVVSPVAPVSLPMPAPERRIPLVPILVLLLLIVLGIGAFFVYQNRDRFFVAQQPPQQITPIIPATITRAPSPTLLTELPTAEQPTIAPLDTVVPIATQEPTEESTQEPTLGASTSEPTDTEEPTVTVELPTLFPTATQIPPTAVPTLIPTRVPTRAPTAIPATATFIPPTNPPAVNCSFGVCVTNIVLAPGEPKNRQNVTFTTTFVNSTGETRSFNWVMLVFYGDNNKGFGESPAQNIAVPPGTSEKSVTYVVVSGPINGCVSFFTRAANKTSAVDKTVFPNTDGQPLSKYFQICP